MSVLGAYDIADLLAALIERSLIAADLELGRYHMLETVREYAAERAYATGEHAEVHNRHLAYYFALGQDAGPQLREANQRASLERLETEHGNLRAALDWSLDHDPEMGIRLAVTISEFWGLRGHVSEGRSRLAGLLAAEGPSRRTKQRASALQSAAHLAWQQSDYRGTRALCEESLSISKELGDLPMVANTLNTLGTAHLAEGSYAAAQRSFEESLEEYRALGFDGRIASALLNLGNVALEQGDYSKARSLYEDALASFRRIGDSHRVGLSLLNLGDVCVHLGRFSEARTVLEEGLAIQNELGDTWRAAYSLHILGALAYKQSDFAAARAYFEQAVVIKSEHGDRRGAADSLEGLGSTEAAQGRAEPAAIFWGAAERIRVEIGAPLPPSERELYDNRLADARASLGNTAFDAAWQDGRAMTLEQAVAFARELSRSLTSTT